VSEGGLAHSHAGIVALGKHILPLEAGEPASATGGPQRILRIIAELLMELRNREVFKPPAHADTEKELIPGLSLAASTGGRMTSKSFVALLACWGTE